MLHVADPISPANEQEEMDLDVEERSYADRILQSVFLAFDDDDEWGDVDFDDDDDEDDDDYFLDGDEEDEDDEDDEDDDDWDEDEWDDGDDEW